jgi:hypothetical protein
MTMQTLRAWVLANPTDPTDPAFRVDGGPTTLADAIAAGHDAAVAECLNRVRASVDVPRGKLTAEEFLADWTPTMDAGLTNQQRNWLSLQLTAGGGINTAAPAVAPVLALVNYPTTRKGSVAEAELGHPVSVADVANALNRRAPKREQRKVCDATGAVYLASFEDGVEVERHAHPDGLQLDPAVADPAMTESQINAALRLQHRGRQMNPAMFVTPTPAERAAFIVAKAVKFGQYASGKHWAASFVVKGGVEVVADSPDDAVDGLIRSSQREGW